MIYIYALCCPESGDIRYVGKCKNPDQRLYTHIMGAKSGRTKHHCANWINSLLRRGLSPEMRVLEELPDGSDWKVAEMATIKHYKESGHDLTNSTGGGEGFHDVLPDVIAKRAAARRVFFQNPDNLAKHLAMCREVQAKPEVKQKHSAATAAFWADDSNRQRLIQSMQTPIAVKNRSDAARRRAADPEFAARHTETMRQAFTDPERLAQIRAAGDKCRADPESEARRKSAVAAALRKPETREKFRVLSTEIGSRPEVIAARKKAARTNWADPEFRAKMTAAHTAAKERRRLAKSKQTESLPGV